MLLDTERFVLLDTESRRCKTNKHVNILLKLQESGKRGGSLGEGFITSVFFIKTIRDRENIGRCWGGGFITFVFLNRKWNSNKYIFF